ncbi:MAG: thioredoxin family protein [Pirellulaceae bacterium]|nr:thioredoxin family protein [Pirellulaceae bacterium]
MPTDYQAVFQQALSYRDFLAVHANPDQQQRWQQMADAVKLGPGQRQLLESFTRQMKALCLAGAWCGDCVDQCPILWHIAEASDVIELRFIDRDADEAFQQQMLLCGGARVPQVVFLSEDGEFIGHFGDRTLARYRQMASSQLGAACPTGIVVPEQSLTAAVTAEWLDQFERMQLVLRTSPRLRQLHGD